MTWIKLSLSVVADAVPASEEQLWCAGASAVSIRDAGHDPLLEPPTGATPMWPQCRLEALFGADGRDPGQLLEGLRQQLAHAGDWQITELADSDWERAWMRDFEPMRFGERLWIYPSHHEPPATLPCVVRLDPGLAFGSGTHATTALCLEWLEARALRGETVLDYGCGSGVLAIAALRLGASAALAVDNDPQALLATRENAARNGVSAQLQECAARAWQPAPVDVVVANILAGTLIELAPRLALAHNSGGRLALAGILHDQQQAVCSAYAPWYTFDAPRRRDTWTLLSATRKCRHDGETAAARDVFE